ncbi:hypothetical protein C8Q73DRAFT_17615 [Cubamyces lactineus]|nr:hypothetical protein C8Q73DRAFT_17615 [Cubamyces lactineus]
MSKARPKPHRVPPQPLSFLFVSTSGWLTSSRSRRPWTPATSSSAVNAERRRGRDVASMPTRWVFAGDEACQGRGQVHMPAVKTTLEGDESWRWRWRWTEQTGEDEDTTNEGGMKLGNLGVIRCTVVTVSSGSVCCCRAGTLG